MAARGTRERRPAVWPWLVMPLIVLLVFYALLKVHKQSGAPAVKPAAAASAEGSGVPRP